jgi:SPP1 family predicted phage head-tail adaptor
VLSRRGASEPGRISYRLTLEKAATAADGGGGQQVTWNPVAAVWGEIVPLKAEEAAAGEGVATRVTHRILIRRRGDVVGGDRFRLDGRTFLVRAVHDPAEDGRFLACLAQEERA